MPPLLQQAMASLHPFEEINAYGMPASHDYFTQLYSRFTSDMVALTDELSYLYFDDKPINPGGDDALLFLKHLGLEPTIKTKPSKTFPEGKWSTAKESILHLRYLEGDMGQAMSTFFDWREIHHRLTAFAGPILDSMNMHNLCPNSTDIHNIHGELKITRVTSRRPSMTKKPGEGINLLNLPSRQGAGMAEGLNKRIRNGFTCPPNETLVACDLSQIELALLAHFSQDETLLNIYRNHGDIHAVTAQAMFGIAPNAQDDSRHRKPAKTVNFATIYGGSGHKLFILFRKENINDYDKRQCQQFIDRFHDTYPGVEMWRREVLWKARQNGYVTTHSGMRRCLPNLWSHDMGLRGKAEREAINHIIQGTAQDLIQCSMGWIHSKMVELRASGYKVRLGLQLYDELIYRCEDDVVDVVEDIVMEGLTKHHGMNGVRVPISADSSAGKCWGEL